MNFNPSMFENLRQNMTHADAKSNAQRMATMSDDELKNYARMAGMLIFCSCSKIIKRYATDDPRNDEDVRTDDERHGQQPV